MYQKLSNRIRRDESGFTLVELLVVITILGILAAIVVFSVRGLNEKSQDAACKTDVNMLTTAQEANFARYGVWASSETALKSAGFITTQSQYYDISTASATPTNPYSIVAVATVDGKANPCTAP